MFTCACVFARRLQSAVNGMTLATAGCPKGFDELLSVYYLLHILRTLHTVHSFGIIHGDVKPDNFVLVQLFVRFHLHVHCIVQTTGARAKCRRRARRVRTSSDRLGLRNRHTSSAHANRWCVHRSRTHQPVRVSAHEGRAHMDGARKCDGAHTPHRH
jgi:hypothetical protein